MMVPQFEKFDFIVRLISFDQDKNTGDRSRRITSRPNGGEPGAKPIFWRVKLMKLLMIATVACVAGFLATSAQAAKIRNLDTTPYQIRIVENGEETSITLSPGADVIDLCKTSCALFIGKNEESFEIVSADNLVVEGGEL